MILGKRYGTFFALSFQPKVFTLLADLPNNKKQKDLLWLEPLIHSGSGLVF